MRITPLEIRQHTFEKNFRGYDAEAVDAFLLSLSQEWERYADEVKQLRQQFETTEREAFRMKEIESSLFKTLKAAEDTQKQINDQAHADAHSLVSNAQEESSAILSDARKQSARTIADAENRARYILEDAMNELKVLERDLKNMERYKDFLVVELKSYANDCIEKVSRFEEKVSTESTFEQRNEELQKGLDEINSKAVGEVVPNGIIVSVPKEEPKTGTDEPEHEVIADAMQHTEWHEPVVEESEDMVEEQEEGETENLIQEVKASRGRPKKVKSIEEEETKEDGSFFDNV